MSSGDGRGKQTLSSTVSIAKQIGKEVLKINMDGVFIVETGEAGMVIRDKEGQPVLMVCRRVAHRRDAEEAGALACLVGTRMGARWPERDFALEADNALMIEKLRTVGDRTGFGKRFASLRIPIEEALQLTDDPHDLIIRYHLLRAWLYLEGAGGELDADGGLGLEAELVAGEAGEDIGLADAGVADEHDLEEVVVLVVHPVRHRRPTTLPPPPPPPPPRILQHARTQANEICPVRRRRWKTEPLRAAARIVRIAEWEDCACVPRIRLGSWWDRRPKGMATMMREMGMEEEIGNGRRRGRRQARKFPPPSRCHLPHLDPIRFSKNQRGKKRAGTAAAAMAKVGSPEIECYVAAQLPGGGVIGAELADVVIYGRRTQQQAHREI
nr:unnamed protein product [Digitaria exilis]